MGSETRQGSIFFIDGPNYAATYVKNGGKVESVTVQKTTLLRMNANGDMNTLNGSHQINGQTFYGTEYQFNDAVRRSLILKMH